VAGAVVMAGGRISGLYARAAGTSVKALVRVAGTPLADVLLDESPAIDPLDFVRTIAVARITMPKSVVRLSAGREDMSEETQALSPAQTRSSTGPSS